MTGVEYWAGTPLAAAIGRTLLHSLWEGAVVALMLAIVLAAARRPLVRYGVACAAMIAMVAAVGATLVVLWPEPAVRYALPHLALTGSAAGGGLASPMSAAKPADVLGWLAPLWAAGAVLFYLRGAAGWIAARRLRRAGVCGVAEFWQERIGQLAARMGVTKTVALFESALAEMPVVMGHLRPVVLLPIGLLAGLPAAQVEAILLHELAHVRRRDYLVNLMQAAVEGILFYHPAVWWISGVMRGERENCCDDLVVAATGSAREYASALIAIEGMRTSGAGLVMPMAATGGSLMQRVARLLGRRSRRDGVVMPAVAAVLTLAVAAGMALQGRPAPVRKPAVVEKSVESAPLVKAPKNVLVAQDAPPRPQPGATPAPAEAAAKPLSAEEIRHKEDSLKKELLTPYRNWLDNDVAYIISDEEKKAFRQLNADEERDYFMKQFWERRDPTPGTVENEMKEEHYRRLDYVNAHYSTTVPGLKTDRGRIYIQYGPPDELETHPNTPDQAAFEQWRYRFIDGVGQNVIIEFVDRDGTGDYRMTMDPHAKDALLKSR